MIPEEFAEIARIFRSHGSFAVLAHFRPDGDAIGATLALGKMLQGMGKKVAMLNEDPVPERYRFLEGSGEISLTPAGRVEAEVAVSLDNGAWKRHGERSMRALAGVPLIVNIDHHATNERFGQVNCVRPQEAATCCILHKLVKYMNRPLTPAISSALYAGISTDTGSFQYEKTTPEVMRMAAELLENGVDVAEINRRLYQEVSPASLRITREVLNGMRLEENGALCSYALDWPTKRRLRAGADDTADLVDIIRVIRGVKAAAIFEDLGDGLIRVSLRSKVPGVDVSAVAAQFGGGGHAMAAGIRMRSTLEEAREQVLGSLRGVLRRA
ncbi:MAG: bifunctional oligoribonuclease/PAP phosphatase NrnA [Akkermansiaceae bacterium]|nr:bifunctional oligoribonuclease/PAP phosphatase NrnA [Akkermansiaceae bacterium]